MFVIENGTERTVNPAVHAMEEMRREMAGEAEKAGLFTDDDIVALCKEVRRELYYEKNTD